MVFIGLLILTASLLSTRFVRSALPFESLLAVGACGALAVVLFQLDRLA